MTGTAMPMSLVTSLLQLLGVVLPPLLILIRLSAGQEFSSCVDGYYLTHGNCTTCPDQCETCISDNNCTTCERNYYGQTCQLTCEDKCEGLCHKTYGHCTFGCRDGLYPVPGTPGCLSCATDCQVCSSYDDCLLYTVEDSVTRTYQGDLHQEVSTTITITAILISSILVINICAAAFIIYRRMNPKTCRVPTGIDNRDGRRSSHQLPATDEPVMTDEPSQSLLQKPSTSGALNTDTGV